MKRGAVVSIGTFDGVHLGHRAILQKVHHLAVQRNLRSMAYAFTVPPRWVMRGDGGRYLLLPSEKKLALLRQDVDEVVPAAFNEVRNLEPEAFVRRILLQELHAKAVVEGDSFRFGRGQSGDLETLRTVARSFDIDVVRVPSVFVDGEAVSSTRVRSAIWRRDFAQARACLGRPPMLLGTVIHGDRLGEKIGYRTANLQLDPHILSPPSGIYYVHVFGPELHAPGLLYIGTRPTLGGGSLRYEVHVHEHSNLTLYGQQLELHLLDLIREDRLFSSLDQLREQIAIDIAQARERAPSFPLNDERISS